MRLRKLRRPLFLTLFITLCVLVLTNPLAFAWSAGGHKVVALIAWRQLDDATRAKVVQLLEQHPMWEDDFAQEMPPGIAAGPESERQRWIFAQAAIWPDLARKHTTPPRDYHRPTWHYINDPIFLEPQLAEEFSGHLPLNLRYAWDPSVDAELQNAPQTVAMAKSLLRDNTTPPEKKAVAICWLFHVVGDLHQPLHCTTLISRKVFRAGDKGGNGIELRKEGSRNGKTLHAFWDGLLKGNVSLNEASQTMVSILQENGEKEVAEAGANLNVEEWVKEGKRAARSHAYTQPILDAVRAVEASGEANGKVGVPMTAEDLAGYGRAAGQVASQRAAIAGYRLGGVLGSIFKP